MNTQGTDGRSVTEVLPEPSAFDIWAARRFIMAERAVAGAYTPLGHRCSNMIELIENYQTAESPEQVSHIKTFLVRTVAEIAAIKGRPVLPAPPKMLTYQPEGA